MGEKRGMHEEEKCIQQLVGKSCVVKSVGRPRGGWKIC